MAASEPLETQDGWKADGMALWALGGTCTIEVHSIKRDMSLW